MEEQQKSPVFECKSIRKQFDSTVALNEVDMVIRSGEIIGLIGENGAGKSTLLKIIMGFQPQTSGIMYIHGKVYAPAKTTDANKAGIGMVYQEQSLLTIAAVALGGTSLSGGIGTMYGALLGTCIASVITNGMTVVGIGSWWQRVVFGSIIVIAAFLTSDHKRMKLIAVK